MGGAKGFEVGKGIGKDHQGIVEPVEAVAQKDKACLGSQKRVEKKEKKPEE